jgi:phosphoglycolate phosphatase
VSALIRHVVWDWNGTLLDDAWLCVEIMNGCLEKRGLPTVTMEHYANLFRFPVRDYYADLGFDFERETFEDLGKEFIEKYEIRRLECVLQPGAAEVVAALHARGIGQSVLSAYRHESLIEFVAHFGLDRYIADVTGADDVYAYGKVEKGRAWVRSLACGSERAVLAGDTSHDVDTARAMGIGCVLFPGGHETPERLSVHGVPVLSARRELLEWLRGGERR